jgi:scyllo-inositol 2-dehydrogenase (NADP+)
MGESEMKKVKVGLIGFGNSGKTFHALLMLAHGGFEIEMVCSSRVGEVLALLPNTKVVSSAEVLIENPGLQLIVNCAPNPLHYVYTKLALEQGKHVVVEKPFVNSVAEGEELITFAHDKNLLLSVFHNRRYDADFLTVKTLIASGRLGELKQFESHFDRYRPKSRLERWREQAHPGSGIFYDLGAHLIDQALVLFGAPEKVFADILAQKPDALVDDYFHLVLVYKKFRVILHASSYSAVSARFQIAGEKATFVKYGFDPQEEQLKSGMSPGDSKFGTDDASLYGTLTNSENLSTDKIISERGNYLRFYEELYLALSDRRAKVPVEARDALRTIKLIELAVKSSKEGKVLPVSFLGHTL